MKTEELAYERRKTTEMNWNSHVGETVEFQVRGFFLKVFLNKSSGDFKLCLN